MKDRDSGEHERHIKNQKLERKVGQIKSSRRWVLPAIETTTTATTNAPILVIIQKEGQHAKKFKK